MKLPNKDMIKLEEAYQSILEARRLSSFSRERDAAHFKPQSNIPEPSPEGEAILDAVMQLGDAKEKAKANIIGKHVTVYKKEMTQNFANKSELPDKEIKAGERLHITSSVTGATPICSGVVQDVLWQTQDSDVQLVLDTMEGEHTVPFGLRKFLVVKQ